MNRTRKKTVLVAVMIVLGLAMIVVGAVGGMAPPILTGVGFLVIAWANAGGGALG